MSNKVFQQNLDDKKGPQPGGPYLIQMLFKEPVEMPDKEKMTAVMEKHIESTECFCYDQKMAGFAAQEHIAEFKDGKCPVQLMVMKCDKFKGKGFDAFMMSQMWDCQEDRERIFRECKYQVVATDTSIDIFIWTHGKSVRKISAAPFFRSLYFCTLLNGISNDASVLGNLLFKMSSYRTVINGFHFCSLVLFADFSKYSYPPAK